MTLELTTSPPQYALLTCQADWCLFGGAAGGGKSYALMLDQLRHAQGRHAKALFRGAIFRKTFPQLSTSGGLIDQTKELYAHFGARYNHTNNEHRFPCGAKISLNTLDHPNKLQSYLGAQFDALSIDEANQFTLKQVLFLWGRCRSKCGVKPTLRMSSNPDRDSWLYPLVHWYLTPDGYPDKSKSGRIRHFRIVDDVFQWFDEPQYEYSEETGQAERVTNTFAFIPSKLTDNKALLQSDPAYRQRLMQLSTEERERFLEGNWLASSQASSEWPRDLFTDVSISVDEWPRLEHHTDSVRMFAVDPSKGRDTRRGDYSSICCLMQTARPALKFVDADLKRRPPGQIVEDLFRFCEDPLHRIRGGDLIGIEAVAFQEILHDLIMQYAADHLDCALSKFLRSGNVLIPIRDTLPKHMRIRRLDGPLRRREFRFLNNPGTDLLLSQLRTFDGKAGKDQHDDGPDSLDMCQQLPLALERHYEELRKA